VSIKQDIPVITFKRSVSSENLDAPYKYKKKGVSIILIIILLSLLVLSENLMAIEAENMEFRGTLIEPPPCNLSAEGTIKVNFGDKVGVKKVASGKYRQSIPVTLHCEQGSSHSAWQLMISVSGNPVSFDSEKATIVTSERDALGVKIYADGKPFMLDSALKVNGDSLPALEAVLVQQEGADLKEGAFSAHATLRVAYE